MSATHEQIEERAYYLWEQRGRPFGSPDVDWQCAEREFRREQEVDQAASWARPARGRRPRPRAT